MTPIPTRSPYPRLAISLRARPYLLWIIANCLGALGALLLTRILFRFLDPFVPSQSMSQLILSACLGFLWALPQWLVLRPYLRSALLWVLPAIISLALVSQADQLTLRHGLWCIVVMTIGQWALLRWSGIPAHWWLLVNVGSFVISGAVIAVIVLPLTFLLDVVDYGFGDRAMLVSLGIGAAIYGMGTGFLLFRYWQIRPRG
jgi:hypothetical protein